MSGKSSLNESFNRSADDGQEITPTDSDIDFDAAGHGGEPPRGISVDVTGTVRVTTFRGTVLNYADGGIVAGVIFQLSVKRVHSTGTTATGIKIYY